MGAEVGLGQGPSEIVRRLAGGQARCIGGDPGQGALGPQGRAIGGRPVAREIARLEHSGEYWTCHRISIDPNFYRPSW